MIHACSPFEEEHCTVFSFFYGLLFIFFYSYDILFLCSLYLCSFIDMNERVRFSLMVRLRFMGVMAGYCTLDLSPCLVFPFLSFHPALFFIFRLFFFLFSLSFLFSLLSFPFISLFIPLPSLFLPLSLHLYISPSSSLPSTLLSFL